MAVYKQEAEKGLQTLEESLRGMPTDMRFFSLAMRALYSTQAVGGDNEVTEKLRKLRDDTRNDAMVYLKGLLPVCTKFVANLSEFFEYYVTLSFDDWCEMLPDILEETTGYKQLAETVVKMHEDILVPLKKREDEAKVCVSEFKGLQEEFEKKKKEFESAAETKRGWAIGLAFIPVVGAIAFPILAVQVESDMAEAIATKEEAEIHGKAAITVSEVLIPALKNFINGLHASAGFFSVMEQELGKFEDKAKKGIDDKKKLHYKMMSAEAKKMDKLCQSFYAVLPAVRTDFEAIPSEGTDKSYVDKWLAKQKETIRSEVGIKKLADSVMKSITG